MVYARLFYKVVSLGKLLVVVNYILTLSCFFTKF